MFKRIVLVSAIVVMLSLLIPSPGWPQLKEDAIRLHKEAYELQQKARSNEDLTRAVQKYEYAIEIARGVGDGPTEAKALNDVGWLDLNYGMYEKANKLFSNALEVANK